jgi:circadian clock protein KaiC
MQRYIETHSELRTVISVVKLRHSRHSRQIRDFEIVDGQVLISAAPAPYEGILRGHPRMVMP